MSDREDALAALGRVEAFLKYWGPEEIRTSVDMDAWVEKPMTPGHKLLSSDLEIIADKLRGLL